MASSMVVRSEAELPAAVSTETSRSVPGAESGQRKVRRVGLAERIGTAKPLTRIVESPSWSEAPEGSKRGASSELSQRPRIVAIEPGVQAVSSGLVMIGSPESTTMGTAPDEVAPAEFEAPKESEDSPACWGAGVQRTRWNSASNEAPSGRPEADTSTGRPEPSWADTMKLTGEPRRTN